VTSKAGNSSPCYRLPNGRQLEGYAQSHQGQLLRAAGRRRSGSYRRCLATSRVPRFSTSPLTVPNSDHSERDAGHELIADADQRGHRLIADANQHVDGLVGKAKVAMAELESQTIRDASALIAKGLFLAVPVSEWGRGGRRWTAATGKRQTQLLVFAK
jgi:hypothetical protein